MASDQKPITVESVRRAPGPQPETRIVPVFTRMGVIEVKAPYTYTLHQHPQYEVIIVDQGTYRASVNDVELALKPNEILIVKPGDWHMDVCERGLRYFAVAFFFDPRWQGNEEPSLFATGILPDQQSLRVERRRFWPILKELQLESGRRDPSARHIQDALLLQFFWRLVRFLPREVISDRFLNLSFDQGFPKRLRHLFSQYLTRPLRVDDIARHLHMSKRNLTLKCTRLLGESPARALLKFKLDHARYLLRNTNMSVKEVAHHLAFPDPYHFSKNYKKHYAVSPSHERRIAPALD